MGRLVIHWGQRSVWAHFLSGATAQNLQHFNLPNLNRYICLVVGLQVAGFAPLFYICIPLVSSIKFSWRELRNFQATMLNAANIERWVNVEDYWVPNRGSEKLF